MSRHAVALVVAILLAAACRPSAPPPERAERALEDVLPEPAIAFAPRTYVAYRAEQPLRVDGRLDEAAWQAAPWTEDFTDIEGPAKPVPRYRTRAKLLWDSANLYIAAQLDEPDVWGTITQRDAVIFRDNDFEVFIDPDGDTHQYYELEVNALGTAWDLFLVKPYRDGGPAINGWDIAGLQVGISVDGTVNRPDGDDRGWSVELALPWAALKEAAHRPAPPAPGDRWRVNFSRVEWATRITRGRYVKLLDATTGRPRPEANWVWSPQGVVNMHYPEMWGIVEFADRGAGERGGATATLRDEDVVGWLLRLVYYRQQAFHARHGFYTNDLRALGFRTPPLAGRPWPPAIVVTPGGYEAWLPLPAPGGAPPRRLLLTADGAVR